jgi:excinuclease ABC subunit C
MQVAEELRNAILNLPMSPGIYQFFDKNDKLLYVGKAKRLKNRVSSYFNKQKYENAKTRLLVKKIHRFEWIVTDTEYDALLLENSLIKKHQPPYNIQLRDDKTYPWICIKNEAFPRVFSTRNVVKDGSEYYGPYPSVRMMRMVLELTQKLYKPRTCSLNLNAKNIRENKFRVCLEYHIGNCLGPCEALQSEESYMNNIQQLRDIIRGNIGEVIALLKQQMNAFVDDLAFEEAQKIKDKLTLLEGYQARSTVVHPTIHNVDVFSVLGDENEAYVNFMKVNNGAIIQSHTVELKKKLDESNVELLELVIPEIRERFQSTSKEIIVSEKTELVFPGVTFTHPQRGDKKKLLEFSMKNARYFMKDRHKMLEKTDPERHSNRILNQIQTDLHLKELPVHMECFDNSNIQGAFPVSACVVFKNGKPSKKEYRHFDVKTVEGPNDFASMEEAVYRRYKRLLEEKASLPQLIVIDGGKGQLSASVNALKKLDLMGKLSIIGIAKRLEEIYFPGDSLPIYLDKRSESLRVIQHMRNEAHRFGITHHRNKRSKSFVKTELTDIEGIGAKLADKLLLEFKSVKNLKTKTKDEIAQVIGEKKAALVLEYFSKT